MNPGESCADHSLCLGRWTGVHGAQEPLPGAGNAVVLRFRSDYSINDGWPGATDPGFSASFECVAGPGVEESVPECLAECAQSCQLMMPPEFEMVPTAHSPFSGCEYGFFHTRRTFESAEAECVAMGGHLASLHSQGDADSLRWAVESGQVLSGTVWLGYTDRSTEGEWAWSDGSPAGFDQWGDEEPNDWGGQVRTHTYLLPTHCAIKNKMFLCSRAGRLRRGKSSADGDRVERY